MSQSPFFLRATALVRGSFEIARAWSSTGV